MNGVSVAGYASASDTICLIWAMLSRLVPFLAPLTRCHAFTSYVLLSGYDWMLSTITSQLHI